MTNIPLTESRVSGKEVVSRESAAGVTAAVARPCATRATISMEGVVASPDQLVVLTADLLFGNTAPRDVVDDMPVTIERTERIWAAIEVRHAVADQQRPRPRAMRACVGHACEGHEEDEPSHHPR